MGNKMSEGLLLFYAAAMGCLASTPFIWCFMFRALMTFEVFSTWQSALYSWTAVIIQFCMLSCCFKRGLLQLDRYFEVICATNLLLTLAIIVVASYALSASIVIPILFAANAIALSFWLPITYQYIYIQPYIVQRYFENGFLSSVVLHYVIIFYQLYLTPLFFLPFFTFLLVGVFAVKSFVASCYFEESLQKSKCIFSQNHKFKYIYHNLYDVFQLAPWEVVIIICILIYMFLVMLFLTQYTEVFYSVSLYLFAFYFGIFCFGGLVLQSQVIVFLYACISALLTALLFVLADNTPYVVNSILLSCLFLLYSSAVNSELAMMRKKLGKAINRPMIALVFALACNIIVSTSLITIRIKYWN